MRFLKGCDSCSPLINVTKAEIVEILKDMASEL